MVHLSALNHTNYSDWLKIIEYFITHSDAFTYLLDIFPLHSKI